MGHRIEFSPEAFADLIDLHDHIAPRSGPATAIGYIDRIENFRRSLEDFPQRGTLRDDLRPGLRVLAFERSATIAIVVTEQTVTILRILYGGRDADSLLTT